MPDRGDRRRRGGRGSPARSRFAPPGKTDPPGPRCHRRLSPRAGVDRWLLRGDVQGRARVVEGLRQRTTVGERAGLALVEILPGDRGRWRWRRDREIGREGGGGVESESGGDGRLVASAAGERGPQK